MNNEDTDFNEPSAEEGDSSARAGAPSDRPLGYWLRAVDALLTREFAVAFEGAGVTRRDWMLLGALSGGAPLPAFAERFARKGKRLRGLEERGWAEESGDGTWVLTDEGRAAKERLSTIVDDIRSRVAGAVPPEDFATTLSSLEAIARELGWDESVRMPRAGVGRGGGFGPGRGFGPGFGRGGFGPGAGFGPGFGRGFGPGHVGGSHCAPGEHEGHHHDAHHHGSHHHGSHHHGHHEGSRGRGERSGRRAERAYERGFDAGFSRGRSGGSADATTDTV